MDIWEIGYLTAAQRQLGERFQIGDGFAPSPISFVCQ